MSAQQPKSPREWRIWNEPGGPDVVNGPDANAVLVIEHSHHVETVARLEAEMAEKRRIIELAIKTTDHALDDRDRWKSCAVKLAEGLRFYADKNNWLRDEDGWRHDMIHEDLDDETLTDWEGRFSGKRAREALKHFDGMEK